MFLRQQRQLGRPSNSSARKASTRRIWRTASGRRPAPCRAAQDNLPNFFQSKETAGKAYTALTIFSLSLVLSAWRFPPPARREKCCFADLSVKFHTRSSETKDFDRFSPPRLTYKAARGQSCGLPECEQRTSSRSPLLTPNFAMPRQISSEDRPTSAGPHVRRELCCYRLQLRRKASSPKPLERANGVGMRSHINC